MLRTPKNIGEYIALLPPEVQEILEQVRATIKEAAPDAEEAIKYRIPTFVLKENPVRFAAFKDQPGFYPTPSAVEEFKDELASYETAKGSVRFPIDKPIPLKLIRKIVTFRVKEAEEKAAAKKRKKR